MVRLTTMPPGLKFRKVVQVPRVVDRRRWRHPGDWPHPLAFGTQTCRYTTEDGEVRHYFCVERGGRRKGPWYMAVETR